MRLDRDKFFHSYRKSFGAIRRQETVAGLHFFLDKFEQETRLKSISEFAYVLATVKHETAQPRERIFFQPTREKRASKTRQPKLYAQQNRYWSTGFYGRGFPQTTWEENYRKAGEILGKGDYFVQHPDELLKPEYAYDVMIVSMAEGLYRKDKTGKRHSLARYFGDGRKDHFNAREIINGDKRKNGYKIAAEAEKFEQILTESLIAAAHPALASLIAHDRQTANSAAPVSSDADASQPQNSLAPCDPTLIPQPIQPVPGGAPEDCPVETPAPEPSFFERWKLRLAGIAGGGGLGAFLSADKLQQLFERFLSLEASILIWIFGAAGVIGSGFLLYVGALRVIEKVGEYFLKIEEMRALRDPRFYNVRAVVPQRAAAPPISCEPPRDERCSPLNL